LRVQIGEAVLDRIRNWLSPPKPVDVETKLSGELPGPFHRTRSIFIHVPKAAGTSVSIALYGYSVGHASIKDRYETDYETTRDYFKFAFVRDPLDRLVSTFSFLKSGGMHIRDRQFADQYARDVDFPTFVRNLQEDEVMQQHHLLLPQMHFIATPNKCVLVNFIGRYENMEKDFATITEIIGAKAELPHKNKSATTDVSMGEETRRLIRDIYEVDYTWLSY